MFIICFYYLLKCSLKSIGSAYISCFCSALNLTIRPTARTQTTTNKSNKRTEDKVSHWMRYYMYLRFYKPHKPFFLCSSQNQSLLSQIQSQVSISFSFLLNLIFCHDLIIEYH